MDAADEARQHWADGRLVDAGRVLQALPVEQRPRWAGGILMFAYTRSGIAPVPEIDRVIEIAMAPLNDSRRWYAAADAFRAVRQVVLRHERYQELRKTVALLVLS